MENEINMQMNQHKKVLALYPQRRHLVLQLLINAALGVITASFLVWSIFTSLPPFLKNFNSPFSEFISTLPLALMAGIILLIVYFLLSSILYISCLDTYVIIRRLRYHRPILSINEQGIAISELPIIKKVFFSWSEIAALRVARDSLSGNFCLHIYPKDMHHLLSSLNRLQRFGWNILRLWSLSFAFPLESADSAIEAHVQEVFGDILREHQIPVYTR